MNKINIRVRISILTGAIIMVVSLISTAYALGNYKSSTKSIRAMIDYEEAEINENEILEDSDQVYLSGAMMEAEDSIRSYSIKLNESMTDSDYQFFRSQMIFSLLMSGMGMVVAYFVSKKILYPITRLAEDVENITDVDNVKPLVIYNEKDEIGKLTKSFNELIKRTNEYTSKQKLFASNVAHELKTPLAIMKGSLQLIDENSSIEEYEEVYRMQDKNIDRLNNIINNLLVVKENNIVLKKIRIDEVVRSVISEQKKLIAEKNIEVHLCLDKVTLETNEDLMYRLISNLVSNATKYNKQNGDIFIELDDERLVVRDSGIGMEEKYLDDIFEPLFCVDKSRSRDLGGSGLGLSIVKDICSSLGYDIDVHSKLSYGSEFIITFHKDIN